MKLKNNISEILLLSFVFLTVIIVLVKTKEQFQNSVSIESLRAAVNVARTAWNTAKTRSDREKAALVLATTKSDNADTDATNAGRQAEQDIEALDAAEPDQVAAATARANASALARDAKEQIATNLYNALITQPQQPQQH